MPPLRSLAWITAAIMLNRADPMKSGYFDSWHLSTCRENARRSSGHKPTLTQGSYLAADLHLDPSRRMHPARAP